jgi:hypothetical protein
LSGSIEIAGATMKSAVSWRVRMVRWLGFDRNPLRRRSDRAEAWLVLLVIVAFVPLSVLAASRAGGWVREGGVREQQASHAHHVSAVLLAGPTLTRPMLGLPPWELAPARWRLGGTTYIGEVRAAYGTPKGAIVRIRVDRNGQVISSSPTAGQLADRVVATEVVAPLVLAVALAFALCVLHWLLNRRRFAGWEAEWWAIDQPRARRPE